MANSSSSSSSNSSSNSFHTAVDHSQPYYTAPTDTHSYNTAPTQTQHSQPQSQHSQSQDPIPIQPQLIQSQTIEPMAVAAQWPEQWAHPAQADHCAYSCPPKRRRATSSTGEEADMPPVGGAPFADMADAGVAPFADADGEGLHRASWPEVTQQAIQSGRGRRRSIQFEVDRPTRAFRRALLVQRFRPEMKTDDLNAFLSDLRPVLRDYLTELVAEHHGVKVWLSVQVT